MNDKAVVIGGLGTVGKATREALDIKYYYDKEGSNIDLKEAHEQCLFWFICLPTPVRGGNYQLGEITDLIKQSQSEGTRNIYVIRSTVYPGYAKFLNKEYDAIVVSHPEFGDEDTMLEDMKSPNQVVLGADSDTFWALKRVQEEFYDDVPQNELIITDNTTAEMIKVSINAFYTTKVIFANEVYHQCERNYANYDLVKHALENAKYGSKNHFDIWHKGGRGAGGKCLQKDMEFFATYTNLDFFKQIREINKQLLDKYPKDK